MHGTLTGTGATLFLVHASNDNEDVFEVDLLREVHRLLMLLGIDVRRTTVAEWIEVLFKRIDIVT